MEKKNIKSALYVSATFTAYTTLFTFIGFMLVYAFGGITLTEKKDG